VRVTPNAKGELEEKSEKRVQVKKLIGSWGGQTVNSKEKPYIKQ